MYLQIRFKEDDRDACRRQGHHVFRSTRVCFGLTCSTSLSFSTVRVHVRRHQQLAPRAASEIVQNMYEDDWVI
ncbi:hypothetical protein T08_3112 [Trichinella sp. T8]|nr:hypothetical protein T08_3112 [Trichinella sp. T8]